MIYLTKPGEHGTLTRYAIEYTDRFDPGCPTFAWRCWAYSEDHALEKFADDPCAEDWHVKRIARVPANAADVRRMKWHTVNQPACIP
jgi:hypothetical protein